MIIMDELTFKYVENKLLKYFVIVANSRSKVDTYVTVADCMICYNNKKYIILKNNSRKYIKKNMITENTQINIILKKKL